MTQNATDRASCEEAFRLHEVEPGKIAAESLGEVMRCPGANPTQAEVAQIVNKKATVSFEEYMAAMGRQVLHEDPKKALMDAFAIFDVGATGKVDASELRQVLGNLAERFTQTEVEEMMRLSEQDADGKLQYKDLIEFAVKNK